jgi:hypothetical protein
MSGPVNNAFISPNFAFLMRYDEVLVRHAALAERYVLRVFDQLEQLLDQAAQAGIVRRILIAGALSPPNRSRTTLTVLLYLTPQSLEDHCGLLSITSYRAKWLDACLAAMLCLR